MLKENPLDGIVRRNKSPGFGPRCHPRIDLEDEDWEWGHKPKNCRNILYCDFHKVEGHTPTHKCMQLCSYCSNWGHSMPSCRKVKNCDLCGRRGHNPYRCRNYNRIGSWLNRARELDRDVRASRLYFSRLRHAVQPTSCFVHEMSFNSTSSTLHPHDNLDK